MRENGRPNSFLGIGRRKLISRKRFCAVHRMDGSRLYAPRGDTIIRERKGAGLIPKHLAESLLRIDACGQVVRR